MFDERVWSNGESAAFGWILGWLIQALRERLKSWKISGYNIEQYNET